MTEDPTACAWYIGFGMGKIFRFVRPLVAAYFVNNRTIIIIFSFPVRFNFIFEHKKMHPIKIASLFLSFIS